MKNETLKQIATQWLTAFNLQDEEKLLALYSEDAQHFSPKLRDRHPDTLGLIKGKAALRIWWVDAFERLPTLRYDVVRLTPFEDRIFMEYIRRVQNEPELYVGEMLEIRDNLIVQSTVFHR